MNQAYIPNNGNVTQNRDAGDEKKRKKNKEKSPALDPVSVTEVLEKLKKKRKRGSDEGREGGLDLGAEAVGKRKRKRDEVEREWEKRYGLMEKKDQNVSNFFVVSALEAELEQARAQIQELETERHSSKKKLEHFLKKVGEKRASWRSKEHEKICAYVDDIKSELSRERKSRQRIEIVNSRLVNELADTKLLAKRYIQDYEKERKARELIEEICDELAKEIGEDKAEIEALKRESMKLREEVEEERKMLQMAEVWREERVHMKLIDAKVAFDEKYSQMNKLIVDLETFFKSMNVNPNAKNKAC